MKKRLISLITVLMLILTMMTFPSARAEEGELTVSFPTWIDETQLDDDYIARTMPHKMRLRGVRDSTGALSETQLNLYTAMKSRIHNVAAGVADPETGILSTEFTIPAAELFTPYQFSAADLGKDKVGIRGEDGKIRLYQSVWDFYNAKIDAFKEEMNEGTNRFPMQVLYCLMSDCPYDLYWFKKSCKLVADKDFAFELHALSDLSGIVISGTFTITLYAANDYAEKDEDSGEYLQTRVDPSYGQAVQNAAANAQAILDANNEKSDYEKMCGYRDSICGMTSYNNAVTVNTPYGNPWQLIWVFDGDEETKVVCEGYAKAFQYLCDMSLGDAESILCQGYMNRTAQNENPHMWNTVSIDGRNYLVDLTNHKATRNLFLVGADGSVADGYTAAKQRYEYDRAYTPRTDSELTLSRWDYTKFLSAGEITLPTELTEIEAEAFTDTPVKTVWVPGMCETIGERAFAGSLLGEIHIAGSGTEIAESAFDGIEQYVTIYAPAGSAAQAYAVRKGIRFVIE